MAIFLDFKALSQSESPVHILTTTLFTYPLFKLVHSLSVDGDETILTNAILTFILCKSTCESLVLPIGHVKMAFH